MARPSAGAAASRPATLPATQLPRRIGLVRDAPDCFASTAACPSTPPRPILLHAVHAPPLRACRRRGCRNTSPAARSGMYGPHRECPAPSRCSAKKSVKKRIDSSYMAPRSSREFREMPLALLVERVEIVDVQPRGAELRGQPHALRVPQHAPRLRVQPRGVVSLPRSAAAAAVLRPASTTTGNSSAGSPVPNRSPAPAVCPAGAFSARYKNAGATSTRASVSRMASSCGSSCARSFAYRPRNCVRSSSASGRR